MDPAGNTAQVQNLLDRLRAGGALDDVRGELIAQASERLVHLARGMLRRFPHLRRWEETDDVLQQALIRLHRALGEVHPESVRMFYGLAATQIRRTLIDLARHHFGPAGAAAHHHTDGGRRPSGDEQGPLVEQAPAAGEPQSLEDWAAFHDAVEKLPETAREVFHLLWYDGLDQTQAADLLGVSTRTIKNRWRDAKLALRDALGQGPQQAE
jgi:RNA polymerase sigma factor (sigma-70 family)